MLTKTIGTYHKSNYVSEHHLKRQSNPRSLLHIARAENDLLVYNKNNNNNNDISFVTRNSFLVRETHLYKNHLYSVFMAC